MKLDQQTFEEVVNNHYASLYRFALSLTRHEDPAGDLTQETFRRFAAKAGDVRDPSKVKSWLFTTLYRQHLESGRWQTRFPHVEVGDAEAELPVTFSDVVDKTDAALARDALLQVDEVFRAPLTLFYLEDHSYREIADILNIPTGTVMSRISRGRNQLRQLLTEKTNHVIPFETCKTGGVA